MARLEIKLLGEIEVSLDRHSVKFPTQKTTELFAYLAVHHRHAHPRVQVAGLLWPDSDEERARANLRQTLSRLRKTLGPENELWIVASSGALRFHAKDVWIDVAEFEKLTQALTPDLSPDPSPKGGGEFPLPFREGGQGGRSADGPEVKALECALALYRGPFLTGVYEDWVLIEQERLQTLYLEALEQLAHVYTERRDYNQAIKMWQRMLREIPWHEQAHRQLIELYALQGDRAAALRQYEEYAEVVQRELHAAPLPEMRALYERLAQGIPLHAVPEQPPVRERISS